MVRVGGGWDTLDHFIAKHDPCRMKFKQIVGKWLQHIRTVFCYTHPHTHSVTCSHCYFCSPPPGIVTRDSAARTSCSAHAEII